MALRINPLSKIIALSGLLALGFLLVVLALALYGTWLPLLDGFLFAIAHLPHLATSFSNSDYQTGFGDIDDMTTSSASDFGKWLSSFLVVSGILLPLSLCRSNILTSTGTFLTIVGGLCIYTTVVIFTTFFDGFSSNDDPFSM